MKLPIQIIKDMVERYSDDKILGRKIRNYIEWLCDSKEK
jgi:hypothetical protein